MSTTKEKPEQSYLRAHSKRSSDCRHTISLEFLKVGGYWHVYQYSDGQAKNWHVTVGRRWKTEKEAEEFLQEQGWEPL